MRVRDFELKRKLSLRYVGSPPALFVVTLIAFIFNCTRAHALLRGGKRRVGKKL